MPHTYRDKGPRFSRSRQKNRPTEIGFLRQAKDIEDPKCSTPDLHWSNIS